MGWWVLSFLVWPLRVLHFQRCEGTSCHQPARGASLAILCNSHSAHISKGLCGGGEAQPLPIPSDYLSSGYRDTTVCVGHSCYNSGLFLRSRQCRVHPGPSISLSRDTRSFHAVTSGVLLGFGFCWGREESSQWPWKENNSRRSSEGTGMIHSVPGKQLTNLDAVDSQTH